uniref:Uncharacterized protein n=1 Tax=Chromera velia CCMP2878 TaxID=1169474 RepID=A0A0G4G4C3_9ALVE|mmetsp:Transcript_8382/g.16265  ORF Transcript_8382/g.16265 Transcript_8382/m.16265 type:complete len:125 (+) Transcript_8382:196-570(+)|eukprot:Cvel_20159.t1-p1 / transcript=Cvel_20159.t1 / gene=Cvel_20159 / organism=Chromera_velia_CCMP2878 / gene_product=hypothetical protein / transcript_product=hypothetical protein / location=Cvel_scaffold1790:18484-18855(+) / protein_length=124 / sequence_SO=supercontig / SO=protein_coding / is_pseudo=false
MFRFLVSAFLLLSKLAAASCIVSFYSANEKDCSDKGLVTRLDFDEGMEVRGGMCLEVLSPGVIKTSYWTDCEGVIQQHHSRDCSGDRSWRFQFGDCETHFFPRYSPYMMFQVSKESSGVSELIA